jgi:hypothetical protein
LDKFGCADADFISYFDPTPPGTTDMRDVYVSAYRRPGGRALLIVGNLAKENREGSVQINGQRLDAPLGEILTWPDAKPLPAADGRVGLTVPRQGYRLLVTGAP